MVDCFCSVNKSLINQMTIDFLSNKKTYLKDVTPYVYILEELFRLENEC